MAIGDKNVVNEVFWTNWAGEQLFNAFDLIAKSADNLQTYIKWVFGLFTTGGFVFIFFKPETIDPCVLVIWGIGFAFLLAATILSTEASMPVKVKFDPNLSVSVERAHEKAVGLSSQYLRFASITAMLGVAAIAAGVLVQFSQPRPVKDPDWKIDLKVQN